MNKLFKSLAFPAISILIVTIIYGGLSIASLNNQTKDLKKVNQTSANSIADLQNQLSQIQNKVNQTLNLNDNLQQSLSAAQKQISGLQTKSTVQTASTPTVITKTITQTVDQQVFTNQATVIIDKDGSYQGGIYQVNLQSDDNAFTILQRAAQQNNFTIKTTDWGGNLGVSIDGFNGDNHFSDGKYWSFYYNGNSSMVGVSNQSIFRGDVIEFRIETY
ncbi:MAG: DUF4430 domain-containing protein [Candidatus Berkelbacteria bacterium]|nr:DUF4430 domain-containing protein [Candidatus Berkelbacteria bacterium]